MQFGLNEDKIRIKPSFSGQRATCPLCNGTIIGKCGEIYVKHWQHHHDRECDPWKEHETDWHRNWKAMFPDNWQEVIIENRGEKHIADVKTSENIVIEFQNSSISSTTIRIRETFYKKMIWVINADIFKNNFEIRSVVSLKLRNLKLFGNSEYLNVVQDFKNEINFLQVKIEEKQSDIRNKLTKISNSKEDLKKLEDILNKSDSFTNSTIDKWSHGEYIWDSVTNKVINNVDPLDKEQLEVIQNKIKIIPEEIKLNEESLKTISRLENLVINNEQFKIVKYEQISSKNFNKVRAISKSSRNSLFQEVIIFQSENQFRDYLHRKEKYDFAIDPSETINSYNKKIDDAKNELLRLNESQLLLKQKIKNRLLLELNERIQEVKKEIEATSDEWDDLIVVETNLTNKRELLKIDMDIEVEKSKTEIEKKQKEDCSKIMRENKGLYTFSWKHERKSWQSADSTIFFDMGENYLFEKVDNGIFKKITKNEFLNKYRTIINNGC